MAAAGKFGLVSATAKTGSRGTERDAYSLFKDCDLSYCWYRRSARAAFRESMSSRVTIPASPPANPAQEYVGLAITTRVVRLVLRFLGDGALAGSSFVGSTAMTGKERRQSKAA